MFLHWAVGRAACAGGVRKRAHPCSNGSSSLQGSSWSWNWKQKRLSHSPVGDLRPQGEEHSVTQQEAASQWLTSTLGRREPRKEGISPCPFSAPSSGLAQWTSVKRRESPGAHLPGRDAKVKCIDVLGAPELCPLLFWWSLAFSPV